MKLLLAKLLLAKLFLAKLFLARYPCAFIWRVVGECFYLNTKHRIILCNIKYFLQVKSFIPNWLQIYQAARNLLNQTLISCSLTFARSRFDLKGNEVDEGEEVSSLSRALIKQLPASNVVIVNTLQYIDPQDFTHFCTNKMWGF